MSRHSRVSSASQPSLGSTSTPWPTTRYKLRHSSWPYTSSDFTRQDNSPDTGFYHSPRFVTHMDDHAINMLKRYYASVLPRRGRILDFCSSWISHYPPPVVEAVQRGELQVVGLGLNQRELDANLVLDGARGRIVRDLNEEPDMLVAIGGATGEEGALFDAATCVVSIDYLTRPLEVLQNLTTIVRPGASVHLVVSNRCFPTKAVRRWLKVDEEERLNMVGDYLHFAGWTNIEILDLGDAESEQDSASAVAGLMKWAGMGGHDPLWTVRGVRKVDQKILGLDS